MVEPPTNKYTIFFQTLNFFTDLTDFNLEENLSVALLSSTWLAWVDFDHQQKKDYIDILFKWVCHILWFLA